MQVSCSGISIIQLDTSINKLLNVWHAKAKGRWILSYNTKRNRQAMSLIFFFSCLIKLPSILGEPYRSNLSFWTEVADQQHPSHYASPILPHIHQPSVHTNDNHDNLHQGQFFAKFHLDQRENKGNTTVLYIVVGRDNSPV